MINFKKNNCRLALVALVLLAMMPARAERVTPEKARMAAQTFLNNNGAKTAQLTDLSKAAGFANLYIFASEQGFVVMAADDCVQPILGYSLTQSPIQPTASFNADDMPDNVRGWLQGYSDEIQAAINSKAKATAETAKQWKDLIDGNSKAGRATTVVEPLIETKWNQNKYYNNLCPAASGGPNDHAYTGCVATAMAQIMKFWNYPSYGIGSHSYTWNNQTLSANFGETTYDWNNMGLYYEYYYPNPTGQRTWLGNEYHTSEKVAAVATLMYHCGVSVDMEYGGSGSGAYSGNVATALKTYFNYSPDVEYKQKSYRDIHGSDNPNLWDAPTINYTDEEWIAMLKAELDARRPLHYSGSDPNSRSGHAFVCDGYRDDNYFHFNWGWAGHWDGYFSLSNLNTGANSGDAGAGNGTYTRDQSAIFGIRPSNNNSAPTNLTHTMQGLQGLTLNWTAATGNVASYNVYRNGNLVGNTTSITYNETAPFGNNKYYVRSVDANGELSLPSNTVSIYVGYQQPVVDDLTATLSGNNAKLTWTAPEWCYPETPSTRLTYGNGTPSNTVGYQGTANMYWGHRYLSSNLSAFSSMVIYKLSFYSSEPGQYEYFMYKGTNTQNANVYPKTQLAHGVFIVSENGWFDIELEERIEIDDAQDLWVFIYDPEAKKYPATFCNFEDNNEGCYFASSDPLSTNPYTYDGTAWLIRTLLTDGTYTYNLYRDGAVVAEGLTETSYNANLNDNAANLFTVKTNYYKGETNASNKAGIAKGTVSMASLEMAANDKMIIAEGSTLTVNGTMSNSNAANLVLEDGAQLVHNSEGVKATVRKAIAGYESKGNGGWRFIASPMLESITPSTENGLISEGSTYDLYYYDEPEHFWRNYTSHAEDFIIERTKGYLYANSTSTTLQLEGTLWPSTEPVTIEHLSRSGSTLQGFNLVGNPFACNATIDQDCYIIEDDKIVLASPAPIIAPCEGVFVKADSDPYSLTFTKATGAKSSRSSKSLDLAVGQGKTTLDRARVRLGEGTNMEKFSLNERNSTQLCFQQDGQEYAVAYADGQDELPVSFKAAENGTYTLSIEANSTDLGYLHLIDNMTGEDIDLLSMPNHTFTAQTTDYASRFRLVFSVRGEADGANGGDDAPFAYISNGEIVITADAMGDVVGDAGTASLQVVDMTGRVIVSVGGHTRCVPTTGIPSGVYVLRLIDGENVKTQKMVIE